jgi:uncharacterized membrane protein
MTRLAIPLAALTICYLLFFGYVAASYGELPARVASHFGLDGRANGWMSREACVAFSIGLALFLPAIVVGMMGGAGKIPVSFINLPHRDYWLAPERRKAALAILLRYALWFASINVLFVTGLHWLIVQANSLGPEPHLPLIGFTAVLGGFLAGTGIWTLLLLRHFSKIN